MQITDIFEHDGQRYRITGFMKEVEIPIECRDVTDVRSRITYDIAVRMNGGRTSVRRKMWCTAEEATLVSGAGVGGVLVPVSEIKVLGPVSWAQNAIEQARIDYAQCYVGEVFYG